MPTVAYRPIPDDYVAATRAHYIRLMRSRRWLLKVAAMDVALSAAAVAFLAALGERDLLPYALGYAALLLVVVATGCTINLALVLPRMVRRMFAQQPLYGADAGFGWTEDGFTIESPLGRSDIRGDQLRGWHEAPACFLFYISERNYLSVPKRVLDREQVAALREALAPLPRTA